MTRPSQEAKEAMLSTRSVEGLPSDSDFVSTGVTLLNLACYGKTYAGMCKGKIYRMVGRSSSGKTFLCRTILAEASVNSNFDDYELIYDDVERGALMDTEKFFGKRLVTRLVPPARTKVSKEPIYSEGVADFYRRIHAKLEAGKKFIWVVDSLDSLKADTETKMSDGKAKAHSQEMRKLIDPLATSGSILLLISQAKTDLRSMWGGDTTSGGLSPEYYSTLEIWLKKIKAVGTTYKGKKYNSGTIISARVKKNRISGVDQNIQFPFHPSYGIDDIGANVDFLCKANHWGKSKGAIVASEWDVELKRNALIRHIEENGLQRETQILVGKVWLEIQKAITPERQPRYS